MTTAEKIEALRKELIKHMPDNDALYAAIKLEALWRELKNEVKAKGVL